jgi:hypothetical protein
MGEIQFTRNTEQVGNLEGVAGVEAGRTTKAKIGAGLFYL